MNEKENDGASILGENRDEDSRKLYEAPMLIMIDTEEIGTGGTNAPEGTNGQLSAGS